MNIEVEAQGPLSPWRLGLIAQVLARDGVIAYPTEGVWGLGCLPESATGAAKILQLKRRSMDQGLLLVAADQSQFEPYLEGLTDAARAELSNHWPGPVTFLVPDSGVAPAWVVGEHPTLGLRVSSHPVVAQLCETLGPLVSTSANVHGHPAALSALSVRRYFGGHVDLVVPGALGGRTGPSEIRRLDSGQRIR